MSCMLVIHRLTGDEIAIPSKMDGRPAEIAAALAARLKPDTCIHGQYGANDADVPAAVVIPATSIDYIVVMELPAAADLESSAEPIARGEADDAVTSTDAVPASDPA